MTSTSGCGYKRSREVSEKITLSFKNKPKCEEERTMTESLIRGSTDDGNVSKTFKWLPTVLSRDSQLLSQLDPLRAQWWQVRCLETRRSQVSTSLREPLSLICRWGHDSHMLLKTQTETGLLGTTRVHWAPSELSVNYGGEGSVALTSPGKAHKVI